MRANHWPARNKAALLLCLCACAASAPTPAAPAPAPGDTSPVQAKTPRTSTDNMRMSEAEKVYVPVQATTRVAEAPRRTYLDPQYGSKFSSTPTIYGQVTITNPYLDIETDGYVTRVAGAPYACTVWRIRPNGEFRRVLFGKKGGVSPAKINIDGIQTSPTALCICLMSTWCASSIEAAR